MRAALGFQLQRLYAFIFVISVYYIQNTNQKIIPIVTEAKFLGVIFDKKLFFIPHLQMLRTKCMQSLNLLKAVSHRDWGGDTQTLLKLYRTLIRSTTHFIYIQMVRRMPTA